MSGINVGRWLAGGVTAGVVMWVLEGLASMMYMQDMQTALDDHALSMELTAGSIVLTVLVSLIAGLTLVFFYAGVRPRFGPGPKTAVLVAIAIWFGSYLLSLIGYRMIGLFPTGLLTLWGIVGLVEMIIATLVGAWIYREPFGGTKSPVVEA